MKQRHSNAEPSSRGGSGKTGGRGGKGEPRSLAVRLSRRLQAASSLDELHSVAMGPCRRAPLRALFPADREKAERVMDAVLESARREAGATAGLDDAFEHESLFRLVRALWRALSPDVSRHDLRLAGACLGAALVFLRAALILRPGLEPDDPARLDALALSLEARWPEVWSRTRQADGEDPLDAAFRESRFLVVTFRGRCAGATVLHERLAALAFALQEVMVDDPIVLPQERIAARLGHPRQRTGELIQRLVRWKVLEIVSEADWENNRAATYRIDPKRSRGACLVNRQHESPGRGQ